MSEEIKKDDSKNVDKVIQNVKLGFLVAFDVTGGILKGLARFPVIAANQIFQGVVKVYDALVNAFKEEKKEEEEVK